MLLALTQEGLSREEASALVQRNAMPVWRGEGDLLDFAEGRPPTWRKALRADELEAMFDLGYHLKEVDTIFRRGVRGAMNRLGLSCRRPRKQGSQKKCRPHGEGNDPYLGFRGEDENDMVRVSR